MSPLDSTDLVISDDPQYFLDDAVIEAVVDVTRTIHHPTKVPTPLVQRDRPWEHVTWFSCNAWTLWRDAAACEFRLLYTDWKLDRDRLAHAGGTIIDWENARLRQLYACSDDGIHWVKPDLGWHPEEGRATNIAFGDESVGSIYNVAPLEDEQEPDPSRRYKAVHTHISPTASSGCTTMRVAYSPDGIRWRIADELPSFGRQSNHLGDVAISAQDPITRTYLLFTRHLYQLEAPGQRQPSIEAGVGATPAFDQTVGVPMRRNRRRIYLSESADFLHWSEPRLVLAPLPGIDNLDDALYGMTPLRLGGQWIGFLNVFHMVTNTMTVELVHSRDGRNWTRLRPSHPWLDRGEPGAFDEFMVNIPSRPITMGDEVFVYYGGAKNHHDWWFAGPAERLRTPEHWAHVPEVVDPETIGYHLGLAKLRLDGYVSLDAGREREGLILTQPLLSPGDRLVINASCGPEGYVKVEVTDVAERSLSGCEMEVCDTFAGDATAHVVTWQGASTIPTTLAGQTGAPYRRLRFALRNAQLYSFRLERSMTDPT